MMATCTRVVAMEVVRILGLKIYFEYRVKRYFSEKLYARCGRGEESRETPRCFGLSDEDEMEKTAS